MRGFVLVLCVAARTAGAASSPSVDGPTRLANAVDDLAAGRFADAEAALSGIVEAAASAPAVGGADRAAYICAMDLLGTILQAQGRIGEAEALLRTAMAAADDESYEGAAIRNGLAGVLVDRGEFDEAERLASRALKIWERRFGKQSVELVRALNTLAEVQIGRGDVAEAERLLRRADRLASGPEGERYLWASVAARRGMLWLSMGRYHEAEPVLERSLEVAEEHVGTEHPALMQLLYTLATCYRLRNRPDDAAALYERYLTLGEKAYGPGHPMLDLGQSGLAQVAAHRR
jgi:tetratricopeptide (TPR) repeat protein